MRVLALSRYARRAASTRQRLLLYAPYLAQHDVHIELASLLDDAYVARIGTGQRQVARTAMAYAHRFADLLRARDFDLLWISYELFPWLPGIFERIAALTCTPYVVDYDDAIFHVYDANPRAIVRASLGRKLEPLISHAAACVCGNEYLAEYTRRFCANTFVVPTVVDTDLYRPVDVPDESAPPAVGWLGSPSTWQNVVPVLSPILDAARHADAEFRVIGAGAPSRGIDGVRAVEWTEAGEVPELQRMTVGVMPLIDAPFQRGKCGYKLIQYMACGVPVVASPVGVNVDIVESSGAGILASTPDEWRLALTTLLDDAQLRERLAHAGRAAAVDRYSLRSQAPRVLDIFTSAAGSGVTP